MIVLNDEGRVAERGGHESLQSFFKHDETVGSVQAYQDSQPQSSGQSENHNEGKQQIELSSDSSKEAKITTRRDGDASTYHYYLRSIGWFQATLFLFYTGIRATFALFPREFPEICAVSPTALTDLLAEVWLKQWAESNTAAPGKDLGKFVGLYIFFGALGVVFVGVAIL